MIKCPVCKAELIEGSLKCNVCGFIKPNIEFLNLDEAQNWENTVLKQCRSIYETMALKVAIDSSCPTIPFDKPRRGCNVRIKDIATSDVICGRIIGCSRYHVDIQLPGKLKALSFDLHLLIEQQAIEYFLDADFDKCLEHDKEFANWTEAIKAPKKEPFRESYDDFVRKNINSHSWCFDNAVIFYNEIHQKANTYFCANDNPPFEIANTITSRDGKQYTVKVTLRNLSKETRNQPIKFRYRIAAPSMNEVHDWTDIVTPAPQYQTAVISFEYTGTEKPYFEIIN